MKKKSLFIIFMLVAFIAFADVYDIGEYGLGNYGFDGIQSYNDEIGGTNSKQYNTTLLDANEVEAIFTFDEEYFQNAASVYVPKAAGLYPAVLLTHGWNGNKNQLNYIGKHLATHGYIAITFYCKDLKKPFEWTHSFVSAYNILVAENSREGSILYRKVNLQKVAIVGHSMGGAGALHTAANFLSDKLIAVVGLNPYNGGSGAVDFVGGGNEELGPDIGKMAIPTLIITGSKDGTAYPNKSYEFYTSLGNIPKAFACLTGMSHLSVDGSGSDTKERKKWVLTLITAWFNCYMEDEGQYASYFQTNGAEYQQMDSDGVFHESETGGGPVCPAFESANITSGRSLWSKVKGVFKK